MKVLSTLPALMVLFGLGVIRGVIGQDCVHGDVRLVQYSGNNQRSYQGRVEVCINGVWGTVTDDGWDSREAKVVCRQLGYSDLVVRPYRFAYYGQGVGLPILMDNVNCQGTEARLIDCPYAAPVSDFHSEDSAVRCYTENDLNSSTCNSTQLRLVGGSGAREGRLEVCMGGQWGTVTDDGFSTQDSKVVCRQLGYVDGYGLTYNFHYYGTGSGTIFLDNVACSGNEANLFNCRYVMAQFDSHSEDVGVKCFETTTYPNCNLGDLRLVNGNNNREGRIEICIDGQWGTIADDGWSFFDAAVACRQLGFASIGAQALYNAAFGQGSGPIWIDVAACNRKELKLLDCTLDGNTLEDSHAEDAGLRCQLPVCTEGAVRLVNGTVSSEGRVELCYGGFWSTVCDRQWGIQEAQVVCRQLGYTSQAVFPYSNAYFGPNSSLPIRIDDTRCTGTEVDLIHCVYDIYVSGCQHSDDAGVRCTAGSECTHGSVQLVGGTVPNEGRLEVCLYGIWGTVTDDNFGTPDATVVCRQLSFYANHGTAVSGAFGTGTGIIHMDNVRCTGSEQRLVDCSYSRDTALDNHGEDVGVRCIVAGSCTDGQLRLVGGNSPLVGRVEICIGGVWGTVTDENWGGPEAKVVCRQLGYIDGYGIPYGDAFFGSGAGPIHMDNVRCTGNEQTLINCTHTPPDGDDSHNQDAGVKCFNQTNYPNCNVGDVRLVGGNTAYEGRGEICIDGMWGSICDNMWSQSDANVLCGQLGYAKFGSSPAVGGTLGQGYGPIWMTEANCSTDAATLLDCQYDGNTGTCTHDNDAGVVCQPRECIEGTVRLMNGTNSMEGRVEVCKSGRWGTVCDSNWGINDAQVVCRQLGFPTANTVALKQATFGQGTVPIRVTNVACSGSENVLLSCTYDINTAACNHMNDAGVSCMAGSQCTTGNIQLVGGETSYEGQVQVCINGRWGTVANEDWGAPDARVVCRQLGFLDIVGVPISGASYGSANIPILMDEVACTGQEMRLIDCQYNPNTEDHTHSQDAGVMCYPVQACSSGSVRLLGGSSISQGRVEICIGGVWGTVGNNGWDTRAAQVVCEQLFGRTVIGVSALNDTTGFGMSQDPVLLHSARCSGSENTLLQCDINSDTSGDTHATDAGVSCITKEPTPSTSSVMIARPTVIGPLPQVATLALPVAVGIGVVIGIVLVAIAVVLVTVLLVLLLWKRSKTADDQANLVASASFAPSRLEETSEGDLEAFEKE